MDEVSKTKLRTLLNVKYVMSLALSKYESDSSGYSHAPLNVANLKSAWDQWRLKHGILNDSEASWLSLDGHVKLEGVADRTIMTVRDEKFLPSGFVLVPEEFATRALVLGYLPD